MIQRTSDAGNGRNDGENSVETGPVPWELEPVRLILVVPDPVGLPEISPVTVFTLKPAGKGLAPKLVGALVAPIV